MLDEEDRLRILDEHDLDYFSTTGLLNELTAFAASLLDAPICLVSLVERDRQRFVAKTGLEADYTRREDSFCQHAMLQDELMVIGDALQDPRFADNPLVTGEPHIRFYAGAPLTSHEGAPLGALCVIDTKPREGMTPLQTQGLKVLANHVAASLQARRTARIKAEEDLRHQKVLEEHESRFRVLADAMPQMVWSTLPDGYHDYYNARWYEFTGMPAGSTDGEGWNGMFHPEDQDRARDRWSHSLITGEPYEIEYRLRAADGQYRWTLGRALPIRDGQGKITRWFGTCTDIHDQRLLLEQRQLVSQELSHRIKNIFSIIAGMISLSARRHPETKALADDLRERVIALGRAHDFVRPHSPASKPKTQNSSLQGMLRQVFEPYDLQQGPRIRISGADPLIDDRSTTPLSLMFHELATNAAKYGALSREGGVVDLMIEVDGDELVLAWRERGGPPIIQKPDRVGFGSQLIEISAVRQLGAKLERDWAEDGLTVSLRAPLRALTRPAGAGTA